MSRELARILEALDQAKLIKGKPVLVNIRTIIGLGSRNQNQGSVHGAALGEDDVVYVKTQLGFNPDAKFVIPPEVYDYFAECKPKGEKLEQEWNGMMERYHKEYPKEGAELGRRLKGQFATDWEDRLPSKDRLPKESTATRKASGIVLKALIPEDKTFVVGSADLLESTFVDWPDMVEFQKVRHIVFHS